MKLKLKMKLKMKLVEGGEIKIPQESVLNFWVEQPRSTKIEYEDENGKPIVVEVAHHALDVAQALAARPNVMRNSVRQKQPVSRVSWLSRR